ncbi:hypothetical protein UNSWDHB_1829 [Dehalobacter sp. UNSWDHB]|nr:hypothetical protein UNSWDHB_1829 [Dehalobacter sp. UNSWDHB]
MHRSFPSLLVCCPSSKDLKSTFFACFVFSHLTTGLAPQALYLY